MRLLKLTSSNPIFRTIIFQPGLNIITGTQLTKEQKKSINGIGKSMSLNLIHYIFGSKFKTKSELKLEEFLSKYGDFILTFNHNHKEYVIRKKFSQSEYYIDNKKISKTNYPKELNNIFRGSSDVKPSFKQILNCFARRYSSEISYYSNILTQQGRPLEDYHQRFTNLSLLGLDMDLVKESYTIKEKLSKLDKAKKTIEEYKKVLDNSNINDIKDEIVDLSYQLENFLIAENFDNLKKEADYLTKNVNDFRNKIYYLENKLVRKEKSLDASSNTEIDTQKITELFNEANFFFKDKVTKRLNEAQTFHKNLVLNRKNRLVTEISDIKTELEQLEYDRNEIGIKRDLLIKDLNNSGALEERDSIKDRITSLENEQQNLEKYEHLLNDFKRDKSKLEIDDAINKKNSILYLTNNKEKIDYIETTFRSLVKRFYDNQGGSFKIEETKKAKYLFDINSHIPKEGSQGVGEVKIFCYDVLLLLLNKNLLNFLAHDGSIFSEMDPRQKSTIFKVILDLLKKHEFQYFVNIGDNSLNEILEIDILTNAEKDLIRKSICLELSDKEAKDWLFGISFD
ncbi:DUF2326 domain-containing protein [Tenacibaculum piscium]|uniref:DUF2326 domain-containing protein n=1 Tax=Tenacibaculum piscium TaxID=1458515 RepID=UPI0023B8B9C8|nr:DUF2326 domain-containing protein [Tenacibaculum piscium]